MTRLHAPTARRFRLTSFVGTAVLAAVALASAPSLAKMPPSSASAWPQVLTLEAAASYLQVPPAELKKMAKDGKVPARRIGNRWRFSRNALQAWLAGDWKLITVAAAPDAAPLSKTRMAAIAGAGAVPGAAAGGTSASGKAIGEAPSAPSAQQVFLRSQSVLLAPGQISLDLSLFYASSDNQQLALVNNNIGLAKLEKDSYTADLLALFGVAPETELFAGTSYTLQDAGLTLDGATLQSSSSNHLGTVRLGLRRTLMHEGNWRPDVVATIEGRVPTGHNSYAVGGGLSLVKSYDPAVLFASANYRHTFSRDFSNVSLLEPQDQIDATFGYALALNDRLSLSNSLSGLWTFGTTFANAKLYSLHQLSLQFGLTALVIKNLYVEPSVSFGLNGPGHSVAVGVTVPYTF